MGKRVLITGANTGLGFETAKVLLREGHEVIMGNRSPERSQRALEELSRLGYPGRVESLPLDLEDRGSIQDFAEAFKERYGSLDVLVNNAGVLLREETRTRNGLEAHFDINYLGHFHLDALLLPSLKEDGLVVSLSSLAHKMEIADIHFQDLSLEGQGYERMKAYSQSKLAMALLGVELSRRFEGSRRRSLIVHPGVSNTDLVSRWFPGLLGRWFMPLTRLAGISGPAEGARSIHYAILREDLKSGSYIGPLGKREWRGEPGIAELSGKALDPELARWLFKESEGLLGISFPI